LKGEKRGRSTGKVWGKKRETSKGWGKMWFWGKPWVFQVCKDHETLRARGEKNKEKKTRKKARQKNFCKTVGEGSKTREVKQGARPSKASQEKKKTQKRNDHENRHSWGSARKGSCPWCWDEVCHIIEGGRKNRRGKRAKKLGRDGAM